MTRMQTITHHPSLITHSPAEAFMKSYWIRHDGNQAVLELREPPIPEPGPGQMLLRVRATSLNRGDLLGAIAFHRAREGRPAGVDAAGEVHAVGEGVRDFRRGDRVMVRGRGCFAEYVLVDPALATPIPPHSRGSRRRRSRFRT